MRRSVAAVILKSGTGIVEEADTDLKGYRAVTEVFDTDIGVMVEVDDFKMEGVIKVREMVDMFGLITGGFIAFAVLRADIERTGQTEKVKAGKIQRGRGGRIDEVSERSSSRKLLLFCVTETILPSG